MTLRMTPQGRAELLAKAKSANPRRTIRVRPYQILELFDAAEAADRVHALADMADRKRGRKVPFQLVPTSDIRAALAGEDR